jgi:class 3 adenylate cyclase
VAEERRLVTVLFADVVGSTELGETLDPEDMRRLLARYYGIAKDVVESHGGTLEKFIGDAIMAVFGLPAAHGDDAERALSAALELRDRVKAEETLRDRIALKFGVNSGEVVASMDRSRGDFLVTGDAVNVAARLYQNGEPWAILCGERTVSAVRDSFAFGPATTLRAKGKSDGVRAIELVGRKPARRVRMPLIGRDDDLAQLDLVARRAFGERRPSLVSIIAPAGTGKTRLLEEFLERLPQHAPRAMVAVAQCLPYGQRLTYWPLRAVLFRLAGIDERAVPSEVRERIAAWLAGSRLRDPTRVADLLAATVGAAEVEVTDRAALLQAWRGALEYAAARGPLVIVFEDLHWSSDSLLDLVEFVMQPRADLPLLMLALARPELLDRRPSWGGGRRNYVSLALEPLPDDAVARLVAHLLETNVPEVAARVVARAEGNPFFAGELVRSLLDRLSSFDDPTAVERALAALPDTVQGTVLARLDLLPAEERRVLQLGAILGRTFRTAGLAALAPSLGDVRPIVERLVEKDLVRPSGSDAYVFRHILIREVAYYTLPRSERATLHAAAARWLQEFARGRDDAFAELIAYHYREAALLTRDDDPERDELRRAATMWSRRAGELALAAAADIEAVRHIEAAIELANAELLPDLYERLGEAHGYGDRAVLAYDRALALCRERGLPADHELRILGAGLIVRLRFQGALSVRETEEQMLAFRASGRATLARASDDRAIATFLIADSFFTFWLLPVRQPTAAELEECEESARRGLAIAERVGDDKLVSAALDAAGSLRAQRGDYGGAREDATRRLAMRELPLTERLDAYSMAAWMSNWLGELDEAIRVSSEGLKAVQPGQVPAWALHLLARRMEALFLRGRWNEVLSAADQALAFWTDAGRGPTGFARAGLLSALRVARARRLVPQRDRLREMIDAITTAVGAGAAPYALGRPLAEQDASAVANKMRTVTTPHLLPHALSILCDLGRPPSDEVLHEVRERHRAVPTAVFAAEVDRCIGLAHDDDAALTRALDRFLLMGAEPFAARIRCERSLLTGDERELAAGFGVLENLGDLDQIERYEARRRV